MVSNALRLRGWKPRFVTDSTEVDAQSEEPSALESSAHTSQNSAQQKGVATSKDSAQQEEFVVHNGFAQQDELAAHNGSAQQKNSSVYASCTKQTAVPESANEVYQESSSAEVVGVDKEGSKIEGKDSIMEKTLHVEGMMCEKCVMHVTKALEGVTGVTKANVSLDEKSAVVELSDNVSDEDLIAAVVEEGYEATMA